MPTPKSPKDPQEDREPEADIDESKRAPMSRQEADEEELAEDDLDDDLDDDIDDDLEELAADDLKDMEGPDA